MYLAVEGNLFSFDSAWIVSFLDRDTAFFTKIPGDNNYAGEISNK